MSKEPTATDAKDKGTLPAGTPHHWPQQAAQLTKSEFWKSDSLRSSRRLLLIAVLTSIGALAIPALIVLQAGPRDQSWATDWEALELELTHINLLHSKRSAKDIKAEPLDIESLTLLPIEAELDDGSRFALPSLLPPIAWSEIDPFHAMLSINLGALIGWMLAALLFRIRLLQTTASN